ncbi:MAG: FkbM family methyltransferase [Flavobacteriaceae bacterium]|nr:FkbM family methyltransferase [Flavobacteriaceae bacterium]
MKIKKLLSGLVYSIKSNNNKLIESNLCGVKLLTINGTIRKKTDQDDAWFFYLAKHHDVIFDIGANIGYTALLAMIQNPSREYILVDPNPLALNDANKNLISNNLGAKAYYFNSFISDTNDNEVKFFTLGSGAAGSMFSSHAESASAVNSFINVKTKTLDFLYQFYDKKPDLVKVDVEGAETLVMEGAYELAENAKCTFFIEMHNEESIPMKEGGQKMIDWCKKTDYKVWYLKTGEELISAETIAKRGKCHLLLLPKEKAYPDYLIGIDQNAPLPTNI